MKNLTDIKQYYLQQMGVITWCTRAQQPAINEWEQLKQQVLTCQKCDLAKTRKHAVYGVGNVNADLVIIGEAPGAQEDKQGEPFVGRAGQLLNEMLQAIGLPRDSVFIANVLKCRPPNNRDPSKEEVLTCTPYLEQQLAMLNPKVILAVGRIAAHYLLGVNDPMAKLRGKQWMFASLKLPLMVTYHPAYLLRNPRDKRKAYQDLQQINRLYLINSK